MIRDKLSLAALTFGALASLASAQSASIYEQGAIEVRPDPEFGRGTDWGSFIESEINGLAVAPDGSVFLAQQRAHTVHKFDRSGRLVKSFGRHGQGPGDFQFPQHLSILDGRVLVVGENPAGRRISLFDLDGRFIKLVRTSQGPFAATAVRDGFVAYVAKSFPRKGPLVLQASSVILLDTNTGREITACDQTLFVDEDQVFASPGGPPPKSKFGRGDMALIRTAGGNLAVGYTTSSKIVIFTPDGRKLREFSLDYPALKWTDDLWRRYLADQVEVSIKLNPQSDPQKLRQSIAGTPRGSEYLSFFTDLLADAEGRLIVLRRGDCFGRCDPILRVYTPEGGLVGESVLRGGDFEVEVDRRFRNLVLAAHGLYGVFKVKDSPDDERRLVRVDW